MVKKFRQNFRSYVLVVIRRLRVTALQVADCSLQKAQPVALLPKQCLQSLNNFEYFTLI